MIRPLLSSIAAAKLLNPLTANAALEVDLWHRWWVHDAEATARIGHSIWDRSLGNYLLSARGGDGINRVAYLRISGQDRKAVNGYVAGLGSG